MTGELLRSLHEGIFEQPLWSGFLDRLRAQAGGHYASLIFRPPGQEDLIELISGAAAPEHFQRTFLERYARDPLPYYDMRVGRVYALEELVEPTDPLLLAFHDEMIRPLDMGRTRLVRVTEPSGVDAWLACSARKNGDATVAALLDALVPHLRSALRAFVAIERERFRSAVTTDAFRRLNFGWVSLDAHARIVDMTPGMDQFFQRSRVLRRGRYDRLTPVDPALDRLLTEAIRRFTTDANATPRAINLSRDPLTDMLLQPVRAPVPTAKSMPVAIAYLSGDRLSKTDRCEQLGELFGLLPSEARLAWAMVQGLSIADAAVELGLTVETARTYSKKIYSKTGTAGQAALIRTILMSVMSLA